VPPVSALNAGHRRAQQGIQAELERQLHAMVSGLPDLSEETLQTYAAASSTQTAAAQMRSAKVAAGYMAARTGPTTRARRRVRLDLEGALSDTIVTDSSPVAVSPVLRARALEPELGLSAALEEAAGYAVELGSNDVQAAQRAGLDSSAGALGARVVGWQKETGGQACPWCELVAGERLYHDADSVPYHDRDRCSVSPVTAE
jgi:hypothetical protein